MNRPIVIINADDFGMSGTVNRAVVRAFDRGLITSATIMANMPGFAEACEMIRERNLKGRIGMHLTLTQGMPLTDPIRRCPRLCNDAGELSGRHGSIWHLSAEEAQAIETELFAQIEAAMANGIIPSHFDSHEHFHTQWPVATVVMRLAKRYRVPAIRLTRNCIPAKGFLRRVYKKAFNLRLARAGFAGTAYFGSAAEAAALEGVRGPIEIMTHPDLDSDGNIVDVTSGAGPLEDASRRWKATGTLMSYGELYGSENGKSS